MRRCALAAVMSLAALTATAQDLRRSGLVDMSPATQALQRDDSQNPALLWVASGEQLWSQPAGRSGQRCADCHGEARRSMRGVATRYPALEARSARPITLAQRINTCRTRHQQAEPYPPESEPLLSLEAHVAIASRGLPIAPPDDAALVPFVERGRSLYLQRIGQLNLSCAQCHDQHAGQRLGGSLIPQGHPTAYPIYRLEWQELGSLQRRLRNCMTGVRAEAPAWNAAELVELELYLMRRAAGMTWESPGVRP